jgi:hypothetical protein
MCMWGILCGTVGVNLGVDIRLDTCHDDTESANLSIEIISDLRFHGRGPCTAANKCIGYNEFSK